MAPGVAPLLLLLFFFFPLFSMADPRTNLVGLNCTSSPAASGAVLADNFVPSMDNLSSRVDQAGFGTSLVGRAPNAVFALAQCYGDLDSVDCQLCFLEIRSQLPKCYPNTGGRIFLDGCFGRYDNHSFFGEFSGPIDHSICAQGKNSSNPAAFGAAVSEVVGNATSSAKASGGYAVASGSSVYALAQCWKNLDSASCLSCLDSAAKSISACAPATEGRALFTGCFIRYSTRLFWNVYPSNSGSSGSSNLAWIIPVSVVSVSLLIAGILVWKKKIFWRKQNGSRSGDFYYPALSAAIIQSNLHFGYDELKKATNNFSPTNKLGQGSYGTVYKAVLADGREVAVKRLLLNTRQWVDQFSNEVNLVNHVRHKNLVKLLGYSVDGPESLLLYEYFYNRSLDLFIFDATPTKHLDWDQRYEIIQGVAQGLVYLHEESETRIIHRDIKASNVLLDEKFKPKITDFGLARSFPEDLTHLSTGIAGTLGYMAPEYVVHGHLTEKADVYSYGILILEIVTGKRCSNSIGARAKHSLLQKVWNHYKTDSLEEIIDQTIYEESLKDEIVHVVKTGLFCTQADPRDRPRMVKVVELLRNSSSGDFLLADPPFLDITIDDEEEGEVSCLLSTTSAPNFSRSTESLMSGR